MAAVVLLADRRLGRRDVHHAAAGSGALQHRGIRLEDREMGDKAKRDRRLGGCFPLKSVNPYSKAASATMTTFPDFDINLGSAYSEAITSPENFGVSEFSMILSPPGIFEIKNMALSVAVGPGQTETTATP